VKVKVRPAVFDDITALMKLAKEVHYAYRAIRWVPFEDNIDGWMDWFILCIGDPEHFLYVAEEKEEGKGALVGLLCGDVGPVFAASYVTKIAYEKLLWVTPDHRGKRTGAALIEKLCEDAKAAGCSDVYIGVSARFKNARKVDKIYRDLGFKLEERHYSRRL
jgi:GNAT superfamily N-acetyltransferase